MDLDSEKDHLWQSACSEFHDCVLPELKKFGKQIGNLARGGDENAKELMRRYEMLYQSFDPITAMLIKVLLEKLKPTLEK